VRGVAVRGVVVCGVVVRGVVARGSANTDSYLRRQLVRTLGARQNEAT